MYCTSGNVCRIFEVNIYALIFFMVKHEHVRVVWLIRSGDALYNSKVNFVGPQKVVIHVSYYS